MWWLTFVERDFVSVLIDSATDPDNAIEIATQNGCNPGGEISVIEMPPNQIPENYRTAMNQVPRLQILTREYLRNANIGFVG